MLLGFHVPESLLYVYGGYTLYAGPLKSFDFGNDFSLLASSAELTYMTPLPRVRNPCRVSHARGLASSAFARHYSRNHRLFSLPVGTEMFHFPTFPPTTLCVQVAVTAHDCRRVSPFGRPRIIVRLPTPRGLSQAPTSFIGSWCQGIHRVPLLT